MKHLLLTTTLIIASATPAFAEGPIVTIENFVGVIKLDNNAGLASVKAIQNDSDVTVNQSADGLTIDGGIANPNGKDCVGYYGGFDLSFSKKNRASGQFGGYKNLKSYPSITLSAPANTVLVIRNAIPFGYIADLGGADIEMTACGRLEIGDITGVAALSIRGSGDINTGDIGDVDIDIRGSGDIETGDIGHARLTLTGSGDIDFGDSASIDLSLTGSGDIDGGHVDGSVRAVSRGSGDIYLGDIHEDLVYDSQGSGDFEAKSVSGRLSIDSGGSGDVDINGGDVSTLLITASGASDVDFDGTAETAQLYATGASDISVDKVRGKVTLRETGAADISVNH